MSEWWSYSPADFLMFAPRTYYRLIELVHRDAWPAQILTLAVGGAILARALGLRVAAALGARAVAVLLAACWAWVAWAFHWQRYATINTAAPWFAVAFGLQAFGLLAGAWRRDALRWDGAQRWARRVGLALLLFALLLHPLMAPLSARPWVQAECFGLTPDPTVAATLGVLLLTRGHAALWVLPTLWCAVSGATLWAMQAADAPLMPALSLLAWVARWGATRRTSGASSHA